MAPEIMASNKYTHKVDVYSFAILCWQTLTGKLPYMDQGNIFDLPNQIINGYRPSLDHFPTKTSTLISNCWQAEADKRPNFNTITNALYNIMGVKQEVGQLQNRLELSQKDLNKA